MSTNTLATYANGEIVDASHPNEITLAMKGEFVGRNANGIPTPGQSLGTLALPWGNMYANGIILNGLALDTSQITSLPNRIVSGQVRPLSSMSDYLRPDGAALEFTILGDTTDLVLSVNNAAASVSTDLVKTGFTAAPAANNTADINDAAIINDKHVGEDGSIIEIDNLGSEWTSRIGQIVAIKGTSEIFIGLLKDATTITNVFRGYFFDSAGSPIKREQFNDDDVLTIMSLGWVFVEDNGTTVDVSYQTPVISFEAPGAPATGQYWFDISNQVWKRYSGVSFDVINRILVGSVVADDTNCIASRSFDFSNQYDELNNSFVVKQADEIVELNELSSRMSVYGTEVIHDLNKIDWNITTDLEGALTEQASTQYYVYLSDDGQRMISDEKPYDRPDLKGFYHPFESWRCIAKFFNNSASDIEEVHQIGKPLDNLVGSVVAMPTDFVPDNCLTCDGSNLRRSEFPELFNAIGTRHGTADGDHFNLPDTRGRFLRGWANGSSLDPDRASRVADSAGGATGDNVGTVQSDNFASHVHNMQPSSNTGSTGSVRVNGSPSNSNLFTENTQATGGNETRPENIYVNYVIKYR